MKTTRSVGALDADARSAAEEKGLSAYQIAQSGLMVALLAVSAQVSIAIGPVPFTLQTLVVALVAILFPPGQAALTIVAYLLLGAAGVPVFSAMRGGIAHLLGPTGGYLYGWIASVVVGSLACRALTGDPDRASEARTIVAYAVAAVVSVVVCYVTGTVHFMAVGALGGVPYAAAYVVGVCVLPFLVPDAIKCVVAVVVARVLRNALPTQ